MNLSRGLRSNGTLKQLHLSFCGLPAEAGGPLSDILANARSCLEVLELSGNMLGCQGLNSLCKGLAVNTKLTTLLLEDNHIDQSEEDGLALTELSECLQKPNIALIKVSLLYNRIGTLKYIHTDTYVIHSSIVHTVSTYIIRVVKSTSFILMCYIF